MIIVIGAGPAGLTMAYYLQQRGLPYQVLEKHAVGWAWHNHYDRLHLHTLKEVSGLPGLPMPDDYPRFPSAAQHLQYLQQYARHFDLNIETGVTVEQATYQQGEGWRIATSHGERRAETLIAATGIWSTPHRPRFDNEAAFKGQVLHANGYRNPAPFAGQRVLVVGGGNTGCEIAVDLNENGVDSSIAVRNGSEFVPHPSSVAVVKGAAWLLRTAPEPVGEWLLHQVRKDFSHLGLPTPPEGHLNTYPVVGYQLPQAVEAGEITLYDTGIARFTPEGVVFEDGCAAEFETVILATGYRPTLQFIPESEVALDHRGWPRLHRGRSVCNPHLFCLGYHYPTTEGWLQSIGRAAKEVVEQL